MGKIVAASGDEEILARTSLEKIQRMKTVFLLSRSVDTINMKITNDMTYGTIDKLKDFDKLENEGVIDYIE